MRRLFVAFSFLVVVLMGEEEWRYLNEESGTLPDNSILRIYFDNDGSVWFCSMYSGLIHFKDGNFQLFNSSTADGFDADWVNDIVKTPSGDYWVATEYKGLYRLKDGVWTQYLPEFSDREFEHLRTLALEGGGPEAGGVIWIGAWSEGLFSFDGSNFRAYNMSDGILPDNSVFDIQIEENPDPAKDERILWVGTASGLVKYDGVSWENFPINGETDMWVNSIALEGGGTLFSDGKMYIGTESGEFIIFDGSEWEIFNISDPWNPNTSVTQILIDADNIKWFATDEQGLGMYDESQLLMYYKSNSGIGGNNVVAMALSQTSDSIEVWCSVYDVEVHGYIGISILKRARLETSILERLSSVSEHVHLLPNFPNPFNPATVIVYEIPFYSRISLDIYDMKGQRIRTLIRGHQEAGEYRVVWDGKDDNGQLAPAGVYLYRLRAGNFVVTRKMSLVR